jgi:multisubunit Na+/H+ antiporter MnhB subunit
VRPRFFRWLAAAALAPLLTLLALAALAPPPTHPRLADEVAAALPRAGAPHPVTAVLLDLRAYDTWLEVAVLLAAVMVVLGVHRAVDLRSVPVPPVRDPVLAWLVRLVVPPMVLVAGYLLWLGSHAPGGAFQAGAVLGATGILLLAAGHRSVAGLDPRVLRPALAAGTAAFLVAGTAGSLAGRRFLEHPADHAGSVILLVETAAALSIGLTLVALFAGARGGRIP